MNDRSAAAWVKIITASAAAIATVIGALALAGAFSNDSPAPAVVAAAPPAIAVDGPDKDVKRDDALPLGEEAQEQLEETVEAEGELGSDPVEGGLRGRDSTPAGVIPGPLAAQEWPGCRTAFVRNHSLRTQPVKVILWHETVSRENGLASQNALTARANDPTTQVSWNFLIGRTNGLCTYTVPVNLKAWHAANANSPAVGIEVEADGTEPSYVAGAGKEKLLAVTRRIGRIYGIPMQRAIVRFDSHCNPIVIKPGIAEHHDMGGCGGGHVDVCSTALCHTGGPESAEKLPWRIDPLIREAAAGACDAKCKARERQKRVVDGRARKHQATHARMGELGCLKRIHSRPVSAYRRPQCRSLKRRDVRQRKGRLRASAKLRSL